MNNSLTFVIVKNGNGISNQRSIRLYWDNWNLDIKRNLMLVILMGKKRSIWDM